MTRDWRDFRPAIWLAMIGIAAVLVLSPFYFGAALIGAAVGVAFRVHRVRRRAARSSPPS